MTGPDEKIPRQLTHQPKIDVRSWPPVFAELDNDEPVIVQQSGAVTLIVHQKRWPTCSEIGDGRKRIVTAVQARVAADVWCPKCWRDRYKSSPDVTP